MVNINTLSHKCENQVVCFIYSISFYLLKGQNTIILLIQQEKKFAQAVICCMTMLSVVGFWDQATFIGRKHKVINEVKIQQLFRNNKYSVILMISHKTFYWCISLFFSPPTDIWCFLKLHWKLIQGGLLNNKTLNP